LEAYIKTCCRAQFPAPWDFISPDPNAYLTPDSPREALADLAKHYSEEELIGASLAHRSAAGELGVHPFLADPHKLIIVLREQASKSEPNSSGTIMTEHGCISGFRYPLFAVLFDTHTIRAIDGGSQDLFVTGTLEDAFFLRSCGRAAVPVVGVTELNDRGIHLFCDWFSPGSKNVAGSDNVFRPQPFSTANDLEDDLLYAVPRGFPLPKWYQATSGKSFVQLTFVNWSPYLRSADSALALRKAINSLLGMSANDGLELHDLQLWTPAADHIKSLQFAALKRNVKHVGKALRASYDATLQDLAIALRPKKPLDLVSVTQQLEAAFRPSRTGYGSQVDRDTAIVNYRKVAHADLIEPLLRQAQADADPVQRGRFLRLADLHTRHVEMSLLYRQETYVQAATTLRTPTAEETKLEIDLQKLNKEIMALENCISKWKPNDPSPSPSPRKKPRNFAAWEFLMQN
jgi:hypothetical protein